MEPKLMAFKPELIAIDLDGTLIDSAPDLAFACNEMLKRLGMATYPQKTIEQWVGNGAVMLVKRPDRRRTAAAEAGKSGGCIRCFRRVLSGPCV